MSNKETNLVWIDMEMTGLDPEVHRPTAISLLITSQDLDIIYEGTEFYIHQPSEVLSQSSNWVIEHSAGVLEQSKLSKFTEFEIQNVLLKTIREHVDEGVSPLCGNSVWQDRRFLAKYFPLIDKFLLHRLIDVSTIKELYKRWCPGNPIFKKKDTHTALEDIKESIAELRYYREVGFIT